MALQAVQNFDAVFALERSINGLPSNERLTARRRDVAPLVKDLVDWMTRERAKLSRHNDVGTWLFAGSDRGAERAAIVLTLIKLAN